MSKQCDKYKHHKITKPKGAVLVFVKVGILTFLPLIVTISNLFAYFSKVYMLHSLKGQPDAEVLRALELRSDWFLKEYKIAAANYNYGQTVNAISVLKDYDLRSKGVGNDNTSNGEEELMKEMFWKLMH